MQSKASYIREKQDKESKSRTLKLFQDNLRITPGLNIKSMYNRKIRLNLVKIIIIVVLLNMHIHTHTYV